jgi:transcriptional regulator with XRE-family HTH domain
MTTEDFVEWLKIEIKNRGWSQADLSRKSGISPSQITRLFNGERGIGGDSIIAISQALNIPVNLVFEKARSIQPKTNLSPIKRQIMHLAEQADDDDLELIIGMLEKAAERKQSRNKNGATSTSKA